MRKQSAKINCSSSMRSERVTELSQDQALLISGGSVGDYWGVGDGAIGSPDSACASGLTAGVFGGLIAGSSGGIFGAIAGAVGGLIAASPACE